jgi:hypothetical protein
MEAAESVNRGRGPRALNCRVTDFDSTTMFIGGIQQLQELMKRPGGWAASRTKRWQ